MAKAGQVNCDFIHSQIKAAADEIDGLLGDDVFAGAGRNDAASRVQALEARTAGYQTQLGTCGSQAEQAGVDR